MSNRSYILMLCFVLDSLCKSALDGYRCNDRALQLLHILLLEMCIEALDLTHLL